MYFTEKQLHILEFIHSFRAARGISPTMGEIAKRFGVTKITIYEHLTQLERKGALKRERFRARSIIPLIKPDDRNGRYVMPFLGVLPRGKARGEGHVEETLDLTAVLPLSNQCFALRVRGSSLIGDQIRDGDYVIVERRTDPQKGDIVVAGLRDGRTALRRYYREKSRIRLQASNPSVKPIYAREVEVRGVVVGLLRNYGES